MLQGGYYGQGLYGASSFEQKEHCGFAEGLFFIQLDKLRYCYLRLSCLSYCLMRPSPMAEGDLLP